MTKNQLTKFYKLNKQIAIFKQELLELNQTGASITQNISGMPGCGSIGDSTARYVERKIFLETKIYELSLEMQEELEKLIKFINTIHDEGIKTVIELRSIQGMSFDDIGKEMNEESSTVKQRYYRFVNSLDKM